MIGIGVIGYGYWGPNLVRNFMELPDTRVIAVSDLRAERLAAVQNRYPTIKTSSDYRELYADPAIDAVVIATPVATHYELALQALCAGKHVLLEKPFTTTVAQGWQLIEVAARRRLVLMVDHTFVYTDAVRTIKSIIAQGRIGPIYYYDSVRINLGLVQHDVNVLWDLAVHDLAIMEYVLEQLPIAVAATGTRHLGPTEEIAYLTCFFEQNLIAHVHVSWLAPVKMRRTLIGGGQQMIVYDDLEPSEKVKVYDKGVILNDDPTEQYQLRIGYRSGDMWSPQVHPIEALHTEARHFLECITQGQQPLTSGLAGLRVVQLLEAANRSLAQRGQPVELDWERMGV